MHELLPVCRFDIKLEDTANAAQCFIDRHGFAGRIAAIDDCGGVGLPITDNALDDIHDVTLYHLFLWLGDFVWPQEFLNGLLDVILV